MVGNYELPPDIDLTEDGIFQGRNGFITTDNHNLPWEEDKLSNITFRYVTNTWNDFEIVSDNLWSTENVSFNINMPNKLLGNQTSTSPVTITTSSSSGSFMKTSNSYNTIVYNNANGTMYYNFDTYFESFEDEFYKYYKDAFGKDISPVYKNEYIQSIDMNEYKCNLFVLNCGEVDITGLIADYDKMAHESCLRFIELHRKLSNREFGMPFSTYEPDEEDDTNLISFTGWERGRYYKNVLPWEETDSSEILLRNRTDSIINTTIVTESLETLIDPEEVVLIA